MEAQRDAANRLEEISPIIGEIIGQLRMGVGEGLAHALVYKLRKEIGYVVRDLDQGQPVHQYMPEATELWEAYNMGA